MASSKYLVGLFRFYNNNQFSDLIREFCESRLYAHEIVLAQWSTYFAKAFLGQFADRDLQCPGLENCRSHFTDILHDERFVKQYVGEILFGNEFALASNLHVGKTVLEGKEDVTMIRS